jgi:hypothetical protein
MKDHVNSKDTNLRFDVSLDLAMMVIRVEYLIHEQTNCCGAHILKHCHRHWNLSKDVQISLAEEDIAQLGLSAGMLLGFTAHKVSLYMFRRSSPDTEQPKPFANEVAIVSKTDSSGTIYRAIFYAHV